ncbi:hypothetical protein ACFPRL_10290 [Pseudoclavibacter helvolus]
MRASRKIPAAGRGFEMSGAVSRQAVAETERAGSAVPSEREQAVLAHWRLVVEGIPGHCRGDWPSSVSCPCTGAASWRVT